VDTDVIQLHDGELPEEEAAQVINLIGASATRRDMLASIEHVDHAARVMDAVIAPSAEQVRQGRTALQVALVREEAARRRRRVGVIAAGLAAAACVAFVFWPAPAPPSIGTVSYVAANAASAGSREMAVLLGSTVHAPSEATAIVQVSGVATMGISNRGALRIGNRATDFTLERGSVSLQTMAPLTITVAGTGYVVRVDADAAVDVAIRAAVLQVVQRKGSSVLSSHGTERTISAPERVRLDLVD